MIVQTENRSRVLFCCTQSFTLATLYKGLFPYLSGKGFEVEVLVGDREFVDLDPQNFGDPLIRVIPMRRMLSPIADGISLLRIFFFLLANRYSVIHVSTPKASLLVSIAAFISRNGPVVFVYRRRIYELATRRSKRLYAAVDRIIARLSAALVPISRELASQLVEDRVCPPEKLRFIGSGSSNGIDVNFYDRSEEVEKRSAEAAKALGIPDRAPVLLYVGRVIGEKGVDLLPPMFDKVSERFADARLIVVGPQEAERDPVKPETLDYLRSHPRVHCVGYASDPRPYFARSDLFVFPSYFEGFGNVLLEAGAMGRTCIAFDVPGVREAVADGASGLLVPKGDWRAMADAAIALLEDGGRRRRMEEFARDRVRREYSSAFVREEVRKLLVEVAERGRE